MRNFARDFPWEACQETALALWFPFAVFVAVFEDIIDGQVHYEPDPFFHRRNE